MMPSDYLILCHILLVPSLLPRIRVFSNKSPIHIMWTKYWSFSIIISPSNEYSELISIRIDWLDLLAVQETLKSLLQLEASVLQGKPSLWPNSAKTIDLIIQTFVSKVISLLFNMLSRFVIAFIPRSNCLLISWLQSPSSVIWSPRK